jgi:hypothetical protein
MLKKKKIKNNYFFNNKYKYKMININIKIFLWRKYLLVYKNLIHFFLYNTIFFSNKIWVKLNKKIYGINIFYSKAELELYIFLFKLNGISYKELFGFSNDKWYNKYKLI